MKVEHLSGGFILLAHDMKFLHFGGDAGSIFVKTVIHTVDGMGTRTEKFVVEAPLTKGSTKSLFETKLLFWNNHDVNCDSALKRFFVVDTLDVVEVLGIGGDENEFTVETSISFLVNFSHMAVITITATSTNEVHEFRVTSTSNVNHLQHVVDQTVDVGAFELVPVLTFGGAIVSVTGWTLKEVLVLKGSEHTSTSSNGKMVHGDGLASTWATTKEGGDRFNPETLHVQIGLIIGSFDVHEVFPAFNEDSISASELLVTGDFQDEGVAIFPKTVDSGVGELIDWDVALAALFVKGIHAGNEFHDTRFTAIIET
jgi:hypothetical protein